MDGKTVVKYPAAGHKIMADNVIILGDPMVVNLQEHRLVPRLSQPRHGMKWFMQSNHRQTLIRITVDPGNPGSDRRFRSRLRTLEGTWGPVNSGGAQVADVVIEIQGINKSFPGVQALSNMSIDLRSGEVHAVCGENGAGKSTLMKLITGVYQPDSGQMRLNGKPLKLHNPNDAYSKGIAIIFQETSLFPELTVLENIFMGHEIRKSPGSSPWLPRHPRLPGHAGKGEGDLRAPGDGRGPGSPRLRPRRGHQADGGDRQGPVLRFPDPHPGRADGGPDQQGSRDSVRDHPQAEGARRLDALHQPSPRRDLRDRGPRHGHPRRRARAHRRGRTRHAGPACLLDGRPHADNLYPKEDVDIGEVVFEARGIRRKACSRIRPDASPRARSSASRGLPAPAAPSWRSLLCGLARPGRGRDPDRRQARCAFGSYR